MAFNRFKLAIQA